VAGLHSAPAEGQGCPPEGAGPHRGAAHFHRLAWFLFAFVFTLYLVMRQASILRRRKAKEARLRKQGRSKELQKFIEWQDRPMRGPFRWLAAKSRAFELFLWTHIAMFALVYVAAVLHPKPGLPGYQHAHSRGTTWVRQTDNKLTFARTDMCIPVSHVWCTSPRCCTSSRGYQATCTPTAAARPGCGKTQRCCWCAPARI